MNRNSETAKELDIGVYDRYQPYRDGRNGRLKRTIKELSQFDNKKPGDLESEFDHFDAANSYPASPFKGRNIMDLDFMYKQLLDGHKPCNTRFTSDFTDIIVQIYMYAICLT